MAAVACTSIGPLRLSDCRNAGSETGRSHDQILVLTRLQGPGCHIASSCPHSASSVCRGDDAEANSQINESVATVDVVLTR